MIFRHDNDFHLWNFRTFASERSSASLHGSRLLADLYRLMLIVLTVKII